MNMLSEQLLNVSLHYIYILIDFEITNTIRLQKKLLCVKDIKALTRPKATPMAAEAKNITQNLPIAVKKMAALLRCAIDGSERPITVL